MKSGRAGCSDWRRSFWKAVGWVEARDPRGGSHHGRPRFPYLRRLGVELLEDRRLLDGTVGQQAIELFTVSPALFVENQGQWADESVRFVHQGDGVNVAMTDAGPVFQLFQREEDDSGEARDPFDPLADLTGPEEIATQVAEFSAHFAGANMVEPVGLDRAGTYFNYFVGGQENWQTEVPSYETVAYEDLYDGIDLHTWGRRSHLKYEFHVAPGADYRQIQIRYEGIEGLWLTPDGSLQVTLGEGWDPLVDDAPYIYQIIDGTEVEVAGRFVLLHDSTYTFELTANYDPRRELVIDPDLDWATYLGGSDDDYGYDIAADASGNALLIGHTSSADFPTPGGSDTTANGDFDAFVAKVTASGQLAWASYLGGRNLEYGYGISMDAAGNALLTGSTGSDDFPTPGGFDTTPNGDFDAFVAKVTASGQLAWASYLGGNGADHAFGIAVDGAGNALLTGKTWSTDLATPGGFDTTHGGYDDAFVAKVISLPSSCQLAWASYLGGMWNDIGCAISVDAVGDALLTGTTGSNDFPTPGGFDTSKSHEDLDDAFVAKVISLPSSCQLAWGSYLGGSSQDEGNDISVDGAGNALVTGSTGSTDFPTPGGFDRYHNGNVDAFVAKVTSSSSSCQLAWASYLGGSGYDSAEGISVDASGNALLIGHTSSADFPTPGGSDTSYNGYTDAFVAKVISVSSSCQLDWASYLGGSGYDSGEGISVDASDNALLTGWTHSDDFPTPDGFDASLGGYRDAFVAKIDMSVPEPAFPACSTFDTDLDGWTLEGGGVASWDPTEGNPGGYLRIAQPTPPDIDCAPVVAPAEFLGNWSALDQVGELAFDLRYFSGFDYVGLVEVQISGSGGSANFRIGMGDLNPPEWGWYTWAWPIRRGNWTLASGTWEGLLAEVDRLTIGTWSFAGPVVSGVDNICLGYREPSDVGDTLWEGEALGLYSFPATVDFTEQIGNGPHGEKDVDMYRFYLEEPATVVVDVDAASQGSSLDAYLRLFDYHSEIASDNDHDGLDPYLVEHLPAGYHYVGISGYGNTSYNHQVAGSGVAGSTGPYSVRFTFSPGNVAPTLDLTGPAADLTVSQGDDVTIIWEDSDPDDNASILVAYDPDLDGQPWLDADHVWIVDTPGLSEDPDGAGDQYVWKTEGVEPGTYTIWGVIDDGIGEPVYSRALGAVTIEEAGQTIFEMIDFDSGINVHIKSFITAVLGNPYSQALWDMFVSGMNDRFSFVPNLTCGFKLGFQADIAVGEGVEVDLVKTQWGMSIAYSFAEDYWTIARGVDITFMHDIVELAGSDYLKIPGQDDGRPIYAGLQLTGDVCLVGVTLPPPKAAFKKGIAASVAVEGDLGRTLLVGVESPLSKAEFLELTEQDSLELAILDSFGFVHSGWAELIADSLGIAFNAVGFPLISVLGTSDDPLGLLAEGDGDLTAMVKKAVTAEAGLEVSVGLGAGAAVGVAVGVFGKAFAKSDLGTEIKWSHTYDRAGLMVGDDVGGSRAEAMPIEPNQPHSFRIEPEDDDFFVISCTAGQSERVTVTPVASENFVVQIEDPDGDVLIRTTVRDSCVVLPFVANEAGQYFVSIEGSSHTTGGDYVLEWQPGCPDGSFDSGLEAYETENTTLVEVGEDDYAARMREGSPASLSSEFAIPYHNPSLSFDYRVISPGDGDQLEVRLNGQTIWSTSVLDPSNDFSTIGPLDLSAYRGEISALEFYLASVAGPNAVVDLDNVIVGGSPAAEVTARQIFYDDCAFDDGPGSDSRDDSAVPTDKQPLMPGESAAFANYTTYSRGINGIMVDIAGLANPDELNIENLGHYFEFHVGNDEDPDSWPEGPIPRDVTVRESPDNAYAKRVTIIWDDYAIRNQWLQVIVLANANYTGLDEEEVFYFGNAVGESGNSDLDAEVNDTDVALARDNLHNFFDPATVTCPYDYNRDARVNATDMLIARSNQTTEDTALRLIHPPALEGEGRDEVPLMPVSFEEDPASSAMEPDARLGKWAWLCEFDQISTNSRPSQKHNRAEEAVGKLMATYWP